MPFAKKLLSAWIVILLKDCSISSTWIDPDVISLGGPISQNPDFIKGVQKAVDAFVERYEEYTIAPVIQACTYQADANLYGALVNWLQEENQW